MIKAYLLLALIAFGCGCSTFRVAPMAADGTPGVVVELDSEPEKTEAELERELEMYRAIHLEALKQKDEPLRAEAMAAVLDTKDLLRIVRSRPVVEGARSWSQIVRDQFWDFKNNRETTKSIASMFATAAVGTYAAGMWDETDLFGGGGKSGDDETKRVQAEALRAASEKNKNVLRIRGDDSTVIIRDIPQSDNILIESTGNGNDITVDLQRDSGSNR